MTTEYNVYCDESCHLENDGQKAMVLGAVWCPKDKRLEIAERIREIKQKHGLERGFEIKWTKVSPSKFAFYQDIIDYFFDDDDLHFRGLVVPDKSVLDHERHRQDHDEWYYKMYFTMLKTVFDPDSRYYVYIDIKDTLGHEKVEKLQDILCTNVYDFSRKMIADVKRVHSHEVEHLQIADLLIGALSYLHRELSGNSAKEALIARIRQRSGYRLTLNTMMRELKFNLLIWSSRI
ncbi:MULTISPECIES: DUF3800 domain-containing protein [Marinobacter]|uniref:DUF3800 domain-containing protein n=1 Tax=Marinobacter TaxID=2742 RepID=UPI000718E8E1|nr:MULTISPECIES: DUF3800 domain-containing protein [Marinobacter]AMQ88523.1 hypothetical protein ASQ50_07350 [Marinobacter sp. LQ44]MCD1631652.1 DUF3800 domain-containing protein [Marinobacter shengliensis]